jgi:hypothetical protein
MFPNPNWIPIAALACSLYVLDGVSVKIDGGSVTASNNGDSDSASCTFEIP